MSEQFLMIRLLDVGRYSVCLGKGNVTSFFRYIQFLFLLLAPFHSNTNSFSFFLPHSIQFPNPSLEFLSVFLSNFMVGFYAPLVLTERL